MTYEDANQTVRELAHQLGGEERTGLPPLFALEVPDRGWYVFVGWHPNVRAYALEVVEEWLECMYDADEPAEGWLDAFYHDCVATSDLKVAQHALRAAEVSLELFDSIGL